MGGSLPKAIHNTVHSRLTSFVILFAFFWIVAAASYSGFSGKWALNDSSTRFSIDAMLDGSADRPFVYRQLVPAIANFSNLVTTDILERALGPNGPEMLYRRIAPMRPSRTFTKATSAEKSDLLFRYLVVYYIGFLSILGALFALRKVCLDAGTTSVTANIAPASLVLALPYVQTYGGYFYDYTELFFFAISFLLALRGAGISLVIITLLATLNKESFLFYIPTLYFVLRMKCDRRNSLLIVTASLFVAVCVNVAMKLAFSGNPGGMVELHLFENIRRYLSPSAYFQYDATYGLAGPRREFIGSIFIIAAISLRGWPRCPQYIRRYILLASVINFPLFLAFCSDGELRNLSFLFVGFVVLTAFAIEDNGQTRTMGQSGQSSSLTYATDPTEPPGEAASKPEMPALSR